MPRQLLRVFLFGVFSGSTLLSAQVAAIDLPDPASERQPPVIILSGIARETSDEGYRTFFLSAEHPFSPYHHVGVLYSLYLPDNTNSYYREDLQKGSYEWGFFGKFFLHGRLSGRRSHLFFGPQMRFGLRKKIFTEGFAGNAVTYNYRVSTTKFLFSLGGQYRLGHAALEWSLPIGWEYARISSNRPSDNANSTQTHFSAIPGIALGIRL
ncbi:MAG: hypothetical protein ABIQ93_10775 [Saprospiraceae bacterium]